MCDSSVHVHSPSNNIPVLQHQHETSFWFWFYSVFMYSVLYLEKRDQNVFGNNFYKTWVIMMKFDASIELLQKETLQEKVYKTLITDLDKLKQRLRSEWTKLDHVIVVAAIRQWCRR